MKALDQLPSKGLFVLITIFYLTITNSYAQDTYSDTLNCEGGTPTFVVDLSADSDSLWVSDPAERDGSCCGTDDNCVQFSLTLAPDAVGIIFYVPDGCGAAPTGSLFYQVDCGPVTSVGEPLCLDGPGPFTITFCKPGSNENCYSIKSISEPEESDNITITDACLDSLWITGLEEPTISWTSIFPGEIGEYNTLLDCTEGCDTVIVEGTPGVVYPELIQYQVCGESIGACSGDPHCDTLDVNIVPTLEVSIAPEEPTICYGEAGVELIAGGFGGAAPYSYLWNTGETTGSIFVSEPGTYFVEIIDITGCSIAYDTVLVTEYLVPITADAGTDVLVCAIPAPTVDLDGAITGATTAVWSGGLGAFLGDSTDLNATYTPTAEELEAGFVTLILTTIDTGSCPGDKDTVVLSFATFNTEIETVTEDVDCFGNNTGLIDLTPVGGALPITYDWLTGETTEDLTDLFAGTYGVLFMDDNGCMDSLEVVIEEPLPLLMTAETEDVTCFELADGVIDLTITGGTPDYTFVWTTGDEVEDLVGVSGGVYGILVTDANGCTLDSNYTIMEPSGLLTDYSTSSVSCNGFSDGAIDINPGGGTPGYTFDWITGETSEDLTDLVAGVYELTMTDANGCTITTSIVIEEPLPLEVTGEVSDVLCFGEATGEINLTTLGGTPGYSYVWESGEITEDLTGVSAGIYMVSIIDGNGCSIDDTLTVNEPLALETELIGVNILCFGDSTGLVNLTVSGGTPGYTYLWSTGEDVEDISDLTAGEYTVDIIDENGCEISDNIALTHPPVIATSIEGVDETCVGMEDGFANLTVSGGVAPYSFTWDLGGYWETEEDLTDVGAGIFYVEIEDDNGCSALDSIELGSPVDFDAGPDSTFAICTNDDVLNLNSFLMATTTGEWSEVTGSGQFNPLTGHFDPNDLPAGDYIFNYIIPRFTPCTDTIAQFVITVHPLPEVNFTADEVIGCAPLEISFTNTGDYSGSSCVWYLGDGSVIEGCESVSHSYEFPGSFDVRLEVTSDFGCENSFEAENFIHIFEKPTAAFTYHPDYPNVQDPEVEFTNLSEGATAYEWDFGDGSPESNLENPVHLYPETPNAEYQVRLIAISDQGCTDTAYQKLIIEDVLIFYVPNVFTPDGDSFNNDFKPVMTSGYDIYDYHLRIFNRWGEIVFESMNADYGWDGTYGGGDLVQDGVYVWTIDFGETMSDKRHSEQGHVTVLK